MTLLLDADDDDATPNYLWDIYYHLYVDDKAGKVVLEHVKKLLPLLESLQAWKNGPYAKTIKFCDQHTLDDTHQVYRRILYGAENRGSASYASSFKKHLGNTSQALEATMGKGGINLTGMRSSAPVSLQSHSDMIKSFQTYSTTGTVTPNYVKDGIPNPMFASLVSETEVFHYGSDPTLGYHLATAFAPLAENSPLKSNEDMDFKIAEAAKTQFFEWVAAFKEIARRMIVLRFLVADVFACCHTLQYCASTGKPSANWYRRQWDLKVLSLDRDEYGPNANGPMTFDVVDSSNLSDHVGALNIVIATASLLKTEPWATIFTEFLLKRGKSQQETFEKVLCGHPATVLLLLGVSPVQYWTNAKCESHVDEVFLSMIGEGLQTAEAQLHSRLAWKRDDQMSGQLEGRGKLHIDTSALVRVLFDIYLQMFSVENFKVNASSILERSSTYTHFHRGSFSSFLKVVKHRVKTDWPAVCSQLLDRISQDRTLALSTNQLQELGIQMHLQDVSTESWLLGDGDTLSNGGPFRFWKNIPLAVAVTIVVPRPAIDRLYKDSQSSKMAAPTLLGSLRAGPGSPNQWHNMYSDVHIVFGKVKNSPEDENTAIVVEQDERGWQDNSPLIASFVVPTAALQVDPADTRVGICIPPSGQAALLYAQTLGMEMTVFETKISASSTVFITKLLPGLTGHRIVCGGIQNFKDSVDEASGNVSNKILAEVPASESDVTTITGRVDLLSEKGKKLLQEKVPIEIQQRDPFVMDVIFGNKKLVCPIRFPVPVTQAGSRSRVARKSGYVEVIAPVASSKDSEILSDFIYPTKLDRQGLPAALNASHMNLDALPVLDVEQKDKMQWLVTLASLEFSPREKKIRDQADNKDGISENLRVNFKESLLTMFMLASGLQGGQTGMFAINHPDKGGIHMLIFVSAIRLDADNSSVVLDAAAIPFTNQLIASGNMEQFLLLIRTLECATINVNDAELILWKKAIPALVERCRTWSHRSDCEYKRRRATVPLSIEPGYQVVCSCGNGKLPENFISVPEWETAAPNAVRIAISPTFSVPLVEDVVDTVDMAKGRGQLAATDRCRRCRTTDAKDGGSLKKCMRCQVARYCSAECQKKDWKKHRMECMEVDG